MTADTSVAEHAARLAERAGEVALCPEDVGERVEGLPGGEDVVVEQPPAGDPIGVGHGHGPGEPSGAAVAAA
jgi:hypothetical protein